MNCVTQLLQIGIIARTRCGSGVEEPQYHREGMAFGIDCIGQLRHSQLNLWALSLKEEEGGIYVQNHSERERQSVCVSVNRITPPIRRLDHALCPATK
jgi:hypothetical protein